MTAKERQEILEGLRAIRAWVTCHFPLGMDIHQLNSACVINGINAGPLQGIVYTCDRLEKMINKPRYSPLKMTRLQDLFKDGKPHTLSECAKVCKDVQPVVMRMLDEMEKTNKIVRLPGNTGYQRPKKRSLKKRPKKL